MGDKNTRGREVFNTYKSLIKVVVGIYKLFPFSCRVKMLELHRNMRGRIGYGIRYALVKSIVRQCGSNVSIAPGVYLNNIQNLILGSNISIHPMCYIECGPAKESYIQIDNDVSIAHGTTIIATSHTYQNDETDIIKDMPVISKPVHICSNVWIGAKATVLYGVTIKSGCVVGANSVVNKSTEENGIYVGAPAVRVKSRLG